MNAPGPLDTPEAWLTSHAAEPALEDARAIMGSLAGLEAATTFARAQPQLDPAHRAAALSAAALDLAARTKGYPAGLLWTRTGQEQSTGPLPAARRAGLLRACGITSVVDLTAGLGMDGRALLRAGIAVTAVESDQTTAGFLEHNLRTLPPEGEASAAAWQVVRGDGTDPGLLRDLQSRGADAWFVDPARRSAAHDGSRSRPERDPELWSPPWSFVEGLLPARVAAKVAPGFSPGAHWHAEWVSVDRTVVECALYSWPAIDGTRQAAVWADGWHVVVADDDTRAAPDVQDDTAIDALLLEADPAVVRSCGLFALAREIPGARAVGPHSSWLTAPGLEQTERMQALVRAYRIVDEVPSAARRLRDALRERQITSVALKTGDVRMDAARLRTELRVGDDDTRAIVFTSSGSGTQAFLVERMR